MQAESFVSALLRALGDEAYVQERQRCRAAFAPSLAYGRHFGPELPGARAAAVMALVEIDPARAWTDWTIPLTVRPDHLAHHPGQISLPGGRMEFGESLQQAAQREFAEELGLEVFPGEVLGPLQSLYVYNSNFHMTPFLATSPPMGNLTPCRNEVHRLVHLPLRILLDSQGNIEQGHFQRDGRKWTAPVIRVGDDQIWGATAIVLGELAAVIARATDGASISSRTIGR